MEFYIMAIKKSDSSGIPFGNNAGRPANPATGKLYSNGETARLELYTATGWQNIVQEVPGVASITGTYSEATNSGTIAIQGTNFVSGAIASAIGRGPSASCGSPARSAGRAGCPRAAARCSVRRSSGQIRRSPRAGPFPSHP